MLLFDKLLLDILAKEFPRLESRVDIRFRSSSWLKLGLIYRWWW